MNDKFSKWRRSAEHKRESLSHSGPFALHPFFPPFYSLPFFLVRLCAATLRERQRCALPGGHTDNVLDGPPATIPISRIREKETETARKEERKIEIGRRGEREREKVEQTLKRIKAKEDRETGRELIKDSTEDHESASVRSNNR